MQSIVPELARAGRGTRTALGLTSNCTRVFKWHDGNPFTARDVKCT